MTAPKGRRLRQAIAAPALRKALALLSARDRRRAAPSIATSLLSANVSGLMTWSIVPFAQLLFDPGAIAKGGALGAMHDAPERPPPYDFPRILGAGCAAPAFAMFAIQMLQVVTQARLAAGLNHALSRRLLSTCLYQPHEFFPNRHSSDLSANILSEAEMAVSQFYRPAVRLIAASATALSVVLVPGFVTARAVGLLVLAIGGACGASHLAIRGRVRQLGQLRNTANRRRFRDVGEGVQSIKDIKALGREEAHLTRFDGPSRDMREATVMAQTLGSIPAFAPRAAALTGGIAFRRPYVREAEFAQGRALSGLAPALGVLAVAAQRLLPEIQRILDSMIKLQFGAAPVERLQDDLTRRALRPEPPVADADRLRLTRDLVFEGVSCRYPGAAGHGLSDVTLRIPAGRKVGIGGRSGAGKTTLGDMALGLLPPKLGRLIVDRSVDGSVGDDQVRRVWRRSVGFVPQDIFLADAGVAENIALGLVAGGIDMDRVRACGRMARIDGVVNGALRDGCATAAGERGVRQSGGRRQRPAIARALYRGADVIVFDAATGALDTRTEAEVTETPRALPGEKAILLIVRRLGALEVCDLIVVPEDGAVAGIGARSTRRERAARASPRRAPLQIAAPGLPFSPANGGWLAPRR